MNLCRKILGALLCLAAFAATAGPWPERLIKFVVPYPAGAMGDVVGRMIAEELHHSLGQTVLIENRPGAGGNIGSSAVAQAAPDGYTFLLAATNNLVINQFVFKNLGYDPLKAFEPVTMLVDVPSVIFVNAALPAKTFAELVAYARSHPGTLNYGSPGNGTAPQLSMFLIDKAMRMQMAHIPYQGAAPAMQALLGNDVQVNLVGAGLGLAHLRAGKLRALAVSGGSRLAVLPDAPTFDEAGLGLLTAGNWWALAAPRGTPKAVVDRLSAEIVRVLGQPKLRERLTELGVVPIAQGPQAMAAQLQAQVKQWERAVAESGVKIE